MAIRKILHYPDKRLRVPGEPVTDFGPELQTLIDDMAETMYAAPGVGLAATQIGVSKQLFIVDVSSGVESGPGLKDPARIEAFIRAARTAFAAAHH